MTKHRRVCYSDTDAELTREMGTEAEAQPRASDKDDKLPIRGSLCHSDTHDGEAVTFTLTEPLMIQIRLNTKTNQ